MNTELGVRERLNKRLYEEQESKVNIDGGWNVALKILDRSETSNSKYDLKLSLMLWRS